MGPRSAWAPANSGAAGPAARSVGLSAIARHRVGDGSGSHRWTSRWTASTRARSSCWVGSRVAPTMPKRARQVDPVRIVGQDPQDVGRPFGRRRYGQMCRDESPQHGLPAEFGRDRAPGAVGVVTGTPVAHEFGPFLAVPVEQPGQAAGQGPAPSWAPPARRTREWLRSALAHGSFRDASMTSRIDHVSRSGRHGSSAYSIPDIVAMTEPNNSAGDGNPTPAHTHLRRRSCPVAAPAAAPDTVPRPGSERREGRARTGRPSCRQPPASSGRSASNRVARWTCNKPGGWIMAVPVICPHRNV